MLFTKPDEYAIRAGTFLASLPAGKLAGAREISLAENIPMQFLWKILHTLTRRNLIRSFKGLRGGYQLALAPDRITVRMVLEASGGAERLQRCVLGLPQCSDEHACPLHERWKTLRSGISEMLDTNTLGRSRRHRLQIGQQPRKMIFLWLNLDKHVHISAVCFHLIQVNQKEKTMNEATATLRHEHEAILRMLDAAEENAQV